MHTRVKTIGAGIGAAFVAFVPLFKVFDWALIAYWEWQHQGRRMKLTLWADDCALLSSLCLSALVFILAVRYLQRHMSTGERIKLRSLVIGGILGVAVAYFCIVVLVVVFVRRFSS